jgi:hypothetical protein
MPNKYSYFIIIIIIIDKKKSKAYGTLLEKFQMNIFSNSFIQPTFIQNPAWWPLVI